MDCKFKFREELVMKYCIILLYSLIYTSYLFAADYKQETPRLLLANIYQSNIKLEQYWVSEKYDGVRAYWNGKNLISRQGNIFHAPEWFVQALPEEPLDGELWAGRGKFEQVSGTVRHQTANNAEWKKIKYKVFDLPNNKQTFDKRLKQLEKIISYINRPHIQLVKQYKISSHKALKKKLDEIVKQGGEGLMLHLGASLYRSGRNNDLLKLKKHFDAEAIVIKHLPGKGKYKGMLGSILVESTDKKRFKIGSGFSDAERKSPPTIGSTITYKYFGLTRYGIPRFASFVRVRDEH